MTQLPLSVGMQFDIFDEMFKNDDEYIDYIFNISEIKNDEIVNILHRPFLEKNLSNVYKFLFYFDGVDLVNGKTHANHVTNAAANVYTYSELLNLVEIRL